MRSFLHFCIIFFLLSFLLLGAAAINFRLPLVVESWKKVRLKEKEEVRKMKKKIEKKALYIGDKESLVEVLSLFSDCGRDYAYDEESGQLVVIYKLPTGTDTMYIQPGDTVVKDAYTGAIWIKTSDGVDLDVHRFCRAYWPCCPYED